MKRCPECRRDYYDDTLLYCLDDGNALLEGPANRSEPPPSAGGEFSEEPRTAILPGDPLRGAEDKRHQELVPNGPQKSESWELHSLAPDLMVRDEYSKWLDAEITEHMMDGLRKAGLEIDGKSEVVISPNSVL